MVVWNSYLGLLDFLETPLHNIKYSIATTNLKYPNTLKVGFILAILVK